MIRCLTRDTRTAYRLQHRDACLARPSSLLPGLAVCPPCLQCCKPGKTGTTLAQLVRQEASSVQLVSESNRPGWCRDRCPAAAARCRQATGYAVDLRLSTKCRHKTLSHQTTSFALSRSLGHRQMTSRLPSLSWRSGRDCCRQRSLCCHPRIWMLNASNWRTS